MPNNEEKKYTVDDILEEYDNAVNEKKGNDEVLPEEEFIAETDINDVNSVEEQDGIAEENSDEVTEEIFLEDVADEDEEIPEEILEIDTSESENADFILKKEENIEAMVEEAILGEASLWKDNIDSEEMTEAEAAALVSEAQTETPDETEQPEDNSAADEAEKEETVEPAEENEKAEKPEEAAEEMPEDVNDKFLKRFLKGLFPWKGDSIGEIIRKIIFLAAVIVFVGAGVMLVSTLIQSEEAVEEKKENQSIITTTVATTVDSEGNIITIAPTEEEIAEHNFNVAEHFKSINEDYIGYLEVDGCDIYEPIMQGDDNDYYLDHNYYGGTNKAGTVFLDYRCTVSEEYISPNIVFYGHNQEDGTMFGNLKDYKQNVEFYQENPVIKFSPEFETGEYVIYGYFVTHVRPEQHSSGIVFHYHDYIETLNDEETFNWYINEVQKRNQIVSPVDVQYGDKLLCLSTCSNEFSDSRFVVFARRLRDGESIEDFDFSEAYLNYNAEGVDWEAIMSNETTLTEEISETEETEETEEASETEETEETEITEETTAPEASEKVTEKTTKKKYKSYAEKMKELKTATKAAETTVSDEETSAAETSAPDEAAEAETAETTAPSESSAAEETTVTP
ncbi:MAG: class B sortase [Oscillospiraceae bacterium]|nr:class B sortase [Oscillospiraceae bacterium]